jgi:hypothetical protein
MNPHQSDEAGSALTPRELAPLDELRVSIDLAERFSDWLTGNRVRKFGEAE